MKKPDNIVFNISSNEYDSYKKEYPTSFNSKNFSIEKISKSKIESQQYFKNKFSEIKEQYDALLQEFNYNELIFNSKYNFKPIVGKEYYLYENDKQNFLSIIKPEEWDKKCLGKYKLNSRNVWQKI